MSYEKLAAYYDQFIDQELNSVYLELIKKHFNKGTVIDLGCGTAPLSILLAKNNYFVTATDISESMLERAYNNSISDDVKINFFVHNILEPINNNYDIITMSSDVINYLDEKSKVQTAFNHVSEIMNENSVFIFDFLKVDYLMNLIGHHEEIELDDSRLIWDVEKTEKELQIRHKVTIDDYKEKHIQTTFKETEYGKLLNDSNLQVVEQVSLEDRFIYLCKTTK